MQWTLPAFVLSTKKYGEHSALITLFTADYGIHKGIAKNFTSKSMRGLYQPGNKIDATWRARLSEHLGMFTAELRDANAALLLTDPFRLTGLNALCALLETTLPERDPHPHLYIRCEELLTLLTTNHPSWPYYYSALELELLAQLGFRLELEQCVATGVKENLCYVSPKSGCAVSEIAGEPYKTKLLLLPDFLQKTAQNNNHIPPTCEYDRKDLPKSLALTGYFLDKYIYRPYGKPLPAARGWLAEMVKKLPV